MKPVDAHCHLDMEQFSDDRKEVVERAGEELEFVVNAGRDLESNLASLQLEHRYNPVVAIIGLHPTHSASFDSLEEVKQQVYENDPVAIGEIGLDYYHITGKREREKQEEIFLEMLELAEELKKPVVVHTRDAEGQAVEILEGFSQEVMLHCFNGSPELAERALESGMKIGVTTQVLYSQRVQELVEKVPLDNLLLETDSPFLYQGERNEPVHVKETVVKIADMKNVENRKVVEKTTGNAKRLFRQ